MNKPFNKEEFLNFISEYSDEDQYKAMITLEVHLGSITEEEAEAILEDC